MKDIVENLLALQNLGSRPRNPASTVALQIQVLRKQVPDSVLIQFDRWTARGRKAVAVVHHGVCGECHIQLAIGVIGALAFGDDIQRCGNCGRFLYLPEDEPVCSEKPVTGPKPIRHRKKAPSHAS